MELKPYLQLCDNCEYHAYNRTKVELKRSVKWTMPLTRWPYNRTKVELKHWRDLIIGQWGVAYNRTKVELKQTPANTAPATVSFL